MLVQRSASNADVIGHTTSLQRPPLNNKDSDVVGKGVIRREDVLQDTECLSAELMGGTHIFRDFAVVKTPSNNFSVILLNKLGFFCVFMLRAARVPLAMHVDHREATKS